MLTSVMLIVLVVVVVAVVMLMTSQKTGQGVYGGALKDREYPYFEGRKVAGAYGDASQAYYTGVPGRTYERAPRQIPSGQRYQEPAYYEAERYGTGISGAAVGGVGPSIKCDRCPGQFCADKFGGLETPTGFSLSDPSVCTDISQNVLAGLPGTCVINGGRVVRC